MQTLVQSSELYSIKCFVSTASRDFGAFNGVLRMWSSRQCYPLVIFNDDIQEAVEPFQVSLSEAMAGDDVTFINQTLTVYIIDDGEVKQRQCSGATKYRAEKL